MTSFENPKIFRSKEIIHVFNYHSDLEFDNVTKQDLDGKELSICFDPQNRIKPMIVKAGCLCAVNPKNNKILSPIPNEEEFYKEFEIVQENKKKRN